MCYNFQLRSSNANISPHEQLQHKHQNSSEFTSKNSYQRNCNNRTAHVYIHSSSFSKPNSQIHPFANYTQAQVPSHHVHLTKTLPSLPTPKNSHQRNCNNRATHVFFRHYSFSKSNSQIDSFSNYTQALSYHVHFTKTLQSFFQKTNILETVTTGKHMLSFVLLQNSIHFSKITPNLFHTMSVSPITFWI